MKHAEGEGAFKLVIFGERRRCSTSGGKKRPKKKTKKKKERRTLPKGSGQPLKS